MQCFDNTVGHRGIHLDLRALNQANQNLFGGGNGNGTVKRIAPRLVIQTKSGINLHILGNALGVLRHIFPVGILGVVKQLGQNKLEMLIPGVDPFGGGNGNIIDLFLDRKDRNRQYRAGQQGSQQDGKKLLCHFFHLVDLLS